MTQELHYTSVPRGLRPGSQGFCTVACTPRMSGPMADWLEAMSGYQPVYPVHDPSAARNPINFSHFRLTIGGQTVSVLSRVGPAGLDYSGRSNKYAHHVVLEPSERPRGGPAWLLSQPGFMQAAWQGEPRELPEGRSPPQSDRPPGIAKTWKAMTGDAGWAGVLAESFLADARRSAILVFRPGMDLLPLFVEAVALLPPSRRWDVEFSTYFTTPPRGATCPWRGMIAGAPETENALRLPNALVIDLCGAPRRAEGGTLVQQARTGERRGSPEADDSESSRHTRGRTTTASAGPLPAGRPPGEDLMADESLIPELMATDRPRVRDHRSRAPRRPTWVLVAGILAACVVPMAALGIWLRGGPDETKATHPETAVQSNRPAEEKPRVNTRTAANPGASGSPRAAQDAIPAKKPPGGLEKEGPFSTASREGKTAAPTGTPAATQPVEKLTDRADQPGKVVKDPKIAELSASKGAPSSPGSRDPAADLVFLELAEPAMNAASDGGQARDGPPLIARGATIQKPTLIDPAREANGPGETPALKLKMTDPGRIDFVLNETTGFSDREVPLAHLEITDSKTEFRWDKKASGEDRKEARERLRGRILKLTTDNGVRYAILAKKPHAITGPLKIRKDEEFKISTRAYWPLEDTVKPYHLVDWAEPPIERIFAKNLVITRMSVRLGKDPKSIELTQTENDWRYVHEGSDLMQVSFDQGSHGKIRFRFNKNPYRSPAADSAMIEDLLEAPYSVAIGLKIDQIVLEIARIDTPEPKNPTRLDRNP